MAMKPTTFHLQKGLWYKWASNKERHHSLALIVLDVIPNVFHRSSPVRSHPYQHFVHFRKEKLNRKLNNLTEVSELEFEPTQYDSSANIADDAGMQGNPCLTTHFSQLWSKSWDNMKRHSLAGNISDFIEHVNSCDHDIGIEWPARNILTVNPVPSSLYPTPLSFPRKTTRQVPTPQGWDGVRKWAGGSSSAGRLLVCPFPLTGSALFLPFPVLIVLHQPPWHLC